MPAPYAALVLVQSGWTGSVIATVGSTSVTVSPRTRESPASLMARLRTAAAPALSTFLGCSLSSAGVLTVESYQRTTTFSLTFSGNTGTRTGLTAGPYSGAAFYAAATAIPAIVLPSKGLRLDDFLVRSKAGQATSGAASALPGCYDKGQSTIHLYGELEELQGQATDIASTFGSGEQVWDLWFASRLAARLRIDDISVRPLTRLRSGVTHGAELTLRVSGVRE